MPIIISSTFTPKKALAQNVPYKTITLADGSKVGFDLGEYDVSPFGLIYLLSFENLGEKNPKSVGVDLFKRFVDEAAEDAFHRLYKSLKDEHKKLNEQYKQKFEAIKSGENLDYKRRMREEMLALHEQMKMIENETKVIQGYIENARNFQMPAIWEDNYKTYLDDFFKDFNNIKNSEKVSFNGKIENFLNALNDTWGTDLARIITKRALASFAGEKWGELAAQNKLTDQKEIEKIFKVFKALQTQKIISELELNYYKVSIFSALFKKMATVQIDDVAAVLNMFKEVAKKEGGVDFGMTI